MPPDRRARKAPGALPLTDERDLYIGLMRQGMSNAEACRIVGVHIRTGYRWRDGRSITLRTGEIRTYPAITGPTRPVSARFLSEAERVTIADGLVQQQSIRAIAAGLGRAPSTVSREIRRNRDTGTGTFHPFGAQRQAAARRRRPKTRKLALDSELRAFVEDHLDRRWSPEQISRALAERFPHRPEMRVATETIYGALYTQGAGRLRRDPARVLRSGHVRRKRRRRSGERLGRFIAPMLMIAERPAEVADRLVPGHWEGDLIMGRANRSAIGTVVERMTRFLLLLHLPEGHDSARVRDALSDAVSALPPQTAALADLGSGRRDGLPRRVHPGHGRAGLLLRTSQSLAAWLQREHQRPPAPVLPQGHGPQRPHRGGPRYRRCRTQCETAQDTGLGDSFGPSR